MKKILISIIIFILLIYFIISYIIRDIEIVHNKNLISLGEVCYTDSNKNIDCELIRDIINNKQNKWTLEPLHVSIEPFMILTKSKNLNISFIKNSSRVLLTYYGTYGWVEISSEKQFPDFKTQGIGGS